jgi:hypothetical protein
MAGRHLNSIKTQNPDLQIEKIDILKHPLKTLRAGIRLIPALRINQHTLSGIYLNHDKISRLYSLLQRSGKNRYTIIILSHHRKGLTILP